MWDFISGRECFLFYIYVIGKWRVVLDYAKVKITGKIVGVYALKSNLLA